MGLGPITLFDKSFIQSLSLDESVWFDHFYYSVVCPIFFAETLADLSKEMPHGRSAEKEVAKIADKFPDMGGNPCAPHAELCLGNLLGHPVSMDGRIMMRRGTPVKTGERRGYVLNTPPEADAFNRWQQGKFNEVEAIYAKAWRTTISTLDLKATSESLRRIGISTSDCKSMDEAYEVAERIVSIQEPYNQMALAVAFLGIPRQYHEEIMKIWHLRGLQPIEKYAPYAAFVLMIEIFFQICVSSGLISSERPSNRIDVAYLFYLPFCMVFVSSDKLHKRCAPFFLRDNQDFIWGGDLKSDLKALDDRYSELPQATKDLGVMCFASTPPQEGDFLTTRLWERHLNSTWKNRKEITEELPNSNKKLVEELKRFKNAKPLDPQSVDFDPESAESMTIQRKVRKQKGKWLQIPKDIEDD